MAESDRWEEIWGYLQATSRTPVKRRRIRAIVVNPSDHNLPKMRIEAGRLCSELAPGAPREMVIAIFESASFLVVTASRGAGSGAPYFFSREDVRRVEYEREDKG